MHEAAFELRLMTATDIDAAIGLSTLAGWNQTEADWHRLLALEPQGCFVACIDGEVKGTVTTTSYERRFGWIGMVLVHPEVRRCGMGSGLLQQGLQYLQSNGVETTRLDATALGQPVYERAGFVVEYQLERWDGIVDARLIEGDSAHLRSIEPADWPAILSLDAEIFGADRSALLQSLYESSPECSAVCFRDDKLNGYALGRRGVRANYLGPWIAGDSDTAQQLALSVLRHWVGKQVFIDINLGNDHAAEVVRALDLQPQRKLIRMHKGPNTYPGGTERVCGIAGPEVG